MIEKMKNFIENRRCRSAWDRGVTAYAIDLLDELAAGIELGYVDADVFYSPRLLERALLNGASDWTEYSWGGCALIYDGDIAKALCNPSELKRTHNGQRRPNAREEWLDTQARALTQAAELIKRSVTEVTA